jgi:hypothetical protein
LFIDYRHFDKSSIVPRYKFFLKEDGPKNTLKSGFAYSSQWERVTCTPTRGITQSLNII